MIVLSDEIVFILIAVYRSFCFFSSRLLSLSFASNSAKTLAIYATLRSCSKDCLPQVRLEYSGQKTQLLVNPSALLFSLKHLTMNIHYWLRFAPFITHQCNSDPFITHHFNNAPFITHPCNFWHILLISNF